MLHYKELSLILTLVVNLVISSQECYFIIRTKISCSVSSISDTWWYFLGKYFNHQISYHSVISSGILMTVRKSVLLVISDRMYIQVNVCTVRVLQLFQKLFHWQGIQDKFLPFFWKKKKSQLDWCEMLNRVEIHFNNRGYT